MSSGTPRAAPQQSGAAAPHRVLAAVSRGCDRVEWVTVRLAALALTAMVALTTGDALARYFLSAPIEGAMELSNEFLMPTLVYFAISYVYKLGGHVRVSIFSDLLAPSVQRVLLRISDALTVLLFAAITWGIVSRTISSYLMNEYSSSPLGYHLAPSYAIVAVGSFLMTLRTLVATVTGQHPSPFHSADVESY